MRKNRLYAMPTMNCNLHCSHCSIKDRPETYDREKFIHALNNFDGEILLFGGEVTTNLDRMFDLISANKEGKSQIAHISTNLIVLNDSLIEFYKLIQSISTSWNPGRFLPDEYELWKSNCKTISDNGIVYRIMITLTDDLFQFSAREFLTLASEWVHPGLKELKFEHYVGDVTPEYFTRADQWLCDLYKEWDLPIKFENIGRLNCWRYNCENVYSLYPDGTLLNQCPHAMIGVVPSECYTCEHVAKCRPCKLQPYCSYPKELSKLVSEMTKEEV